MIGSTSWNNEVDGPSDGTILLASCNNSGAIGTAAGNVTLNLNHAITPTGGPDTSIGMFWHTSNWPGGQTITWHTGQTGGYTSYFGIDRDARRAVIVLSDISNPSVSEIGIDLLTERNLK